MKTLTLQIVLQSPTLLAAAPPASNLTETLQFIPGNTVRGALAYRYLAQGKSPSDPVFQRLFVQGEARFGCAYITGALPIPLSSRSCKYDPGFTKDKDSEGHGMIDLLLAGNEEQRCTYVSRGQTCGQAGSALGREIAHRQSVPTCHGDRHAAKPWITRKASMIRTVSARYP